MIQKDARMTFTEHLGELRLRLIRSCVAILVGFIFAYIVREQVFLFVASPLGSLSAPAVAEGVGEEGAAAAGAAQQHVQWTALNPLEGFMVQLKLAFYAGLILALPVLVYQICAFIFPGLRPSERRIARFLLIGSTVFVIFGVATAYFAVLPLVMPHISSFVPEGVIVQFRMNETVSMILKALAGFAIAFQFPMVVMVFVYLDLLSPETLRKYRRIAVVLMTLCAAVFTPPDPFSLIAMLLPLWLMYEISIWMAVIIVKKRRRAEAAADTS